MQQPPSESEPQLIDLREFIGVIRRRRIAVVVIACLVVGFAILLVARRPAVYTAAARVEVRPLTADASQYVYYDLLQSMDTEAARVSSTQIATGAYALGAPEGSTATASVPPNTTYLDISCTQAVPEMAQTCADAFAQSYVNDRKAQADEIYDALAGPLNKVIADANAQIDDLTKEGVSETDPRIVTARNEIYNAQAQLILVPRAMATPALIASEAPLPTAPSNKGYITTGLLALILGLALGIGYAFVRERLDERIGGTEDMERALGAPVIAVVPKVPGWRNRADSRVVTVSAPTSVGAEAYRAARTSLLYLAKEGGLQAIAVTGPGQGEGKTTTTVNLAVTLAQSGKHVIAVSCDLRRPRMHQFLGVSNDYGLSDVLTGAIDVKRALIKTSIPGLIVMPSGHVPHNPAELLGSSTMEDLLTELRNIADIVLLDTPPSLVVADALEIAPQADGVLVVADASSTHRSAVLHLARQIERVGGSVIGAILNNVDSSNSKYAEPYGKYYGGGDAYKPTNQVDTNGVVASNGGSSNGHNAPSQTGKRKRRLARAKGKGAGLPPPPKADW
jgi:capsular exopolysaccharide synthesis family protein